MSVITIFSGSFCNRDAVIKDLMGSTGYRLITDRDIAAEAASQSGISEEKIMRAFSSKTSVFNKFTHEKERFISNLRLGLFKILEADELIISGFSSMLIPESISHVLRVCLIADLPYRIKVAETEKKISEKDALKIIKKSDHDRSVWTDTLYSIKDPWNDNLFDMVIPMNQMELPKAGALIQENLLKPVLKKTPASEAVVKDCALAAVIETTLANSGHNIHVTANGGSITLTINKNVLMLGRLEEELKSIVEGIDGVVDVNTQVGKNYHQSTIYRKHNFEVPSRVLLVDDEREFVQTLSERLQLRDMGSAVAYDGKSALDIVNEDEPDVMIIDLKMPGIDGMEVLKNVKETRPGIEVIVLTGHGSETDRQRCMDLGAFAYMQKPVDINILSETLKKAHEKIRKHGDTE